MKIKNSNVFQYKDNCGIPFTIFDGNKIFNVTLSKRKFTIFDILENCFS